MLRKSENFKRVLYIFIGSLIIAAALFSTFSYISARTNVNIIKNSEIIENIRSAGMSMFFIAISELIILGGGIIASLSAIAYLIKLYFEMQKFAMIDPLTEIYNKRATYKMLDLEIKRAERFRHPLTIIMLDIDYFKIYNDKNGHLAGDKLLKRIAGILKKEIRDIDVLGRYGGEEFIIVLPETSHEGAARVAEKIRKSVKDAHFPGEEKQPAGDVTISIGLATFHGEYKAKEHLIASADELLYKAKESGRNIVKRAYFGEKNYI